MEFTGVEMLVFETLQRATSQNIEILKPAEKKLQEWEIEPGYYSVLLKIVKDPCIDPAVRWLAVTCFKNGVDRYWRKTAPNAIREEEKVSLRSGLMGTFREPNYQLAAQLAVLISKIARYDCPSEWPELIPSLLEMSRNEDLLVQHRGLLVLCHVIKTLSTKVLAGDRKIFQNLAADIYPMVLKLWNTNYETFISQVAKNDPGCHGTLERALLSLRTLKKLTISGFVNHHQYPDIAVFTLDLFDRAKKMLYIRKAVGDTSQSFLKLTEEVIINFLKLLSSVFERYPMSFINLIQAALEFTATFLFSEHGQGFLFDTFVVKAMNLMKAVIHPSECKLSRKMKSVEFQEAIRIKSKFFQADTLAVICRTLITKYFILTKENLLFWASNPESFQYEMSQYIGDNWKVNLPFCSYALFKALFNEYRQAMSPVLLQLMESYHKPVDPQNMDAILRKDAVYTAMGLAAFDLYDEVDFEKWLSTTLLQELSIKEPNYRIIRRRVAWLIGEWAKIKLSPEIWPVLYGALIPLLQSDEDWVVRLSAAMALEGILNDYNFVREQFIEFLEPTFSLLFELFKEVSEYDSKFQVLSVLSLIVEQMGSLVKPYYHCLISYLPLLWDETGNHNMLRSAIITTLAHLGEGLVSENLTPFLCSVIELSTDLEQDAHLYLLEDSLDLWYAVLKHSTSVSPQFLQLYRVMPPVLGFSRECLESGSLIIEAYILLNPQQFLMEYGESLASSCLSLLSDLDNEGLSIILKILDIAVRAGSGLAVNILMPVLITFLLNIESGNYSSSVMTKILELVSLVVLISNECFSQLLANAARDKSETSEQLLDRILSIWLQVMPEEPFDENKKLLAFALSSLLTVGSNIVMARLKQILKGVVETLNDIVDAEDLECRIDSVMAANPYISSIYECDTENEKRKKQLLENDPVYTVELRGYFQSQMQALKSKVGAENFAGLLSLVDPETIEQCQLYITL